MWGARGRPGGESCVTCLQTTADEDALFTPLTPIKKRSFQDCVPPTLTASHRWILNKHTDDGSLVISVFRFRGWMCNVSVTHPLPLSAKLYVLLISRRDVIYKTQIPSVSDRLTNAVTTCTFNWSTNPSMLNLSVKFEFCIHVQLCSTSSSYSIL